MIATPEDARLMFHKWMVESIPVRIRLRNGTLIFHGTGAITDFSAGSLQIGGDSWQFTVPLTGAEFAFSDPREIANATIRDLESSKYELGLSVTLPSGDQIVLLELKTEPEPGELEDTREE
jgi:hypothetical protein